MPNKDLEENLLTYREPVELFKEKGYMVILAGLGDQLGCSILDGLKPRDVTIRQSGQDAVAIVKLG